MAASGFLSIAVSSYIDQKESLLLCGSPMFPTIVGYFDGLKSRTSAQIVTVQ